MCFSDSDHGLGPRVSSQCRGFDFTLNFEDAFFHLIPPALFLLLLPIWVFLNHKKPRKLCSHRLTIIKLVRNLPRQPVEKDLSAAAHDVYLLGSDWRSLHPSVDIPCAANSPRGSFYSHGSTSRYRQPHRHCFLHGHIVLGRSAHDSAFDNSDPVLVGVDCTRDSSSTHALDHGIYISNTNPMDASIYRYGGCFDHRDGAQNPLSHQRMQESNT